MKRDVRKAFEAWKRWRAETRSAYDVNGVWGACDEVCASEGTLVSEGTVDRNRGIGFVAGYLATQRLSAQPRARGKARAQPKRRKESK